MKKTPCAISYQHVYKSLGCHLINQVLLLSSYATMLRWFLLICVLASVAVAADERCSLRCYSGTVEWGDDTSLEYAFSVLPCQPVVVVDASLTDEGDQTLLPNFGCVATEHVISITLDHEQTHLEWRYETDHSCEQVLASLDTIPGSFLGTDHRQGESHLKQDGTSLEEAQQMCERQCELCTDSGVILTKGSAGTKSPCGAEGTDECAMRVQLQTDVCTGEVASFDVFVGDDVVPLSAYQPDAVLGAQVRCEDGQIVVESQGVMLQYEAPKLHNGNCEAMLTRVDPLASGSLTRAFIQLSKNEMWTANTGRSLAGTQLLCGAMAAPIPPTYKVNDKQGGEGGDENTPASGETVTPVPLPVDVFVNCSRRRDGACCTIYGYRNPNTASVTAPAIKPYNYFVPEPATRSQVSTFNANTTVTAAFAVIWECPEYERHKLRWVLDLPAETRSTWRRTSEGARERNDCSDAMYAQWCT